MVDLRTTTRESRVSLASGMPAVVVGGPLKNGALPAVWHDEASVDRGDRPSTSQRSATGGSRASPASPSFVHSAARNDGLPAEATRALALSAEVVATDYSPESGAARRAGCSRPRAADRDRLRQRRARRHRARRGAARWASRSRTTSRSSRWDDSLLCQVVAPAADGGRAATSRRTARLPTRRLLDGDRRERGRPSDRRGAARRAHDRRGSTGRAAPAAVAPVPLSGRSRPARIELARESDACLAVDT